MADIGIPASLLERYFSAYGNRSPLENAITPERVQAATEKYLSAQKAAEIQRLLQANRPEGAGNIPIQSFDQLMELMKIEAEKEKKGQEQFNKLTEKVAKWKEKRVDQAAELQGKQAVEAQKRGREQIKIQSLKKKHPEFRDMEFDTMDEFLNYLRFRKGGKSAPIYPSTGQTDIDLLDKSLGF